MNRKIYPYIVNKDFDKLRLSHYGSQPIEIKKYEKDNIEKVNNKLIKAKSLDLDYLPIYKDRNWYIIDVHMSTSISLVYNDLLCVINENDTFVELVSEIFSKKYKIILVVNKENNLKAVVNSHDIDEEKIFTRLYLYFLDIENLIISYINKNNLVDEFANLMKNRDKDKNNFENNYELLNYGSTVDLIEFFYMKKFITNNKEKSNYSTFLREKNKVKDIRNKVMHPRIRNKNIITNELIDVLSILSGILYDLNNLKKVL